METKTIITPAILAQLNAMGFHGPHGNDPEVVNVDGTLVAALKKHGFALSARMEEEFGHPYVVFDLTHYPSQPLHTRAGYAGPVAVFEIRTILKEDLARLPEFENMLINAGKNL